MPKNIPPEFTGRFSIKRKRSPKRKSEPHAAGPSLKYIQTASGNASPHRERANSSASSTHHSNAGSGTKSPVPTSSSKQPERRSPAGQNEECSQTQKPPAHSKSRDPSFTSRRSPFTVDPHSTAESELIETYNALEASATRTPSSAADSPVEIPSPRANDNGIASMYEHDIYRIFSSAYTRLNSHNRAARTHQAASALTDGLLRATDTGYSVYISSMLTTLLRFAIDNPKSIDFILQTYHAATDLFPDEAIRTEHGNGPLAGMNRFRSWLMEESLGFRGGENILSSESMPAPSSRSPPPAHPSKLPPMKDQTSTTTTTTTTDLSPPKSNQSRPNRPQQHHQHSNKSTLAPQLGHLDPHDRSNLKFHRDRISPLYLDSTLSELASWKILRRRTIVMACIHARAFVLGMLRMSSEDGRRLEDLVSAGLVRRQARWSKVDFIASCVMVRACGGALVEKWWAGGVGSGGAAVGGPQGDHSGGASAAIAAGREAVEKRAQLRSIIEGFLLQDGDTWDDEFGIKVHAMMALKSLLTSTRNETSEQIFRTGDWVF